MKNILRAEMRWHENHLTLLCLIAFGLPYLFYLVSVYFVILNWDKAITDMQVHDIAGMLGPTGAGLYLKQKLNFKKH